LIWAYLISGYRVLVVSDSQSELRNVESGIQLHRWVRSTYRTRRICFLHPQEFGAIFWFPRGGIFCFSHEPHGASDERTIEMWKTFRCFQKILKYFETHHAKKKKKALVVCVHKKNTHLHAHKPPLFSTQGKAQLYRGVFFSPRNFFVTVIWNHV